MPVPSPAAALDELKQSPAAFGDASGYVTGCTSALQDKEAKISEFKPSWHLTQSPLRSIRVSGSDLGNKQTLFPDKGKSLIFFGSEDFFYYYYFLFKRERKPQRTFLCFPLKVVLLAGDHLSCTQARKYIFSLSEETGCTLPSATPGTPFSTW